MAAQDGLPGRSPPSLRSTTCSTSSATAPSAVVSRQAEWNQQMASADQKQAELQTFQWQLVREQIGAFSTELAKLRGDVAGLVQDRDDARVALEKRFQDTQDITNQQATVHESHRSVLEEGLDALNTELRREMDALREQLEQLSDCHAGIIDAHASHRAELEEKDQRLKEEISQAHGAHRAELEANELKLREAISDATGIHKAELEAKELKLREEIRHTTGIHKAELEAQELSLLDEISKTAAANRLELEEKDRRLKEEISHAHGAHKKELEAKELKLRDEINSTVACDELEERDRKLKDEISHASGAHKAELEAKEKELRDQIAKLHADHGDRNDEQEERDRKFREEVTQAHSSHKADFEAREKRLREQIDQVAEQHRTDHTRLQDAHLSHKSEIEAKDRKLKDEIAQATGSHKAELEANDRKLRDQIAQLGNEHRDNHARHRGELEVQDRRIREEISQAHSSHKSELEVKEGKLREEITRVAEEHRANHAKLSETLGPHKAELEVLDRKVREQISNLHGSQKSELEAMDRRVKQLADDNKGAHAAIREQVAAHDRELRREVGRISNELQQNQVKTRGDTMALKDLVDMLDRKSKEAIAQMTEKQSAGEGIILVNLEAVEKDLRMDLGKADANAKNCQLTMMDTLEQVQGSLRNELARVCEDQAAHLGAHRAHLERLTSQMEERVNNEKMARQLGENNLCDRLDSAGRQCKDECLQQMGVVQMESRASVDTLRQMLDTEQGQRYEQAGGLQNLAGRLEVVESELCRAEESLDQRVRRLVQAQGTVSRADFEAESIRLWEAMDTHCHNVSTLAPAPVVVAPAVRTRAPMPELGTPVLECRGRAQLSTSSPMRYNAFSLGGSIRAGSPAPTTRIAGCGTSSPGYPRSSASPYP